ncbi:calcium-transporting ATPase 3 [Anopheles sinensis]|uniref:Calcium-transporting ATPase 3 n=1 Tax=Anopheles sinensis TaxID=74873 RepID=A0A084WQH9_ANOSI|nr:calcium-transporting ATPase 3 [Anopheles sinensis]
MVSHRFAEASIGGNPESVKEPAAFLHRASQAREEIDYVNRPGIWPGLPNLLDPPHPQHSSTAENLPNDGLCQIRLSLGLHPALHIPIPVRCGLQKPFAASARTPAHVQHQLKREIGQDNNIQEMACTKREQRKKVHHPQEKWKTHATQGKPLDGRHAVMHEWKEDEFSSRKR